MPAVRIKVKLSDIVSGENPRQDFGDIDALAATIEATGGEPVNPPVVVMDGDRYRLVDGERRVRALRKIHDKQDDVAVIAFDEYDEAESAVAMVATDDKKELSDAERARGFQRMLKLDVPTVTIARATRRKADEVRKAMSVAGEAPEQATLDQMICAAEFEDEEDRAAVLAAGPDGFRRKAEGIRRRIDAEREDAEIRSKIESAGIRLTDSKDLPEGYRQAETVFGAYCVDRCVSDAVEEYGADSLVGYRPGSWWQIATNAPLHERQETDEERAAREARERREAAFDTLSRALMQHAAASDAMPHAQAACGRLRTRVYNYDLEHLRQTLVDLGLDDDAADAATRGPASMYELLLTINGRGRCAWFRWVSEILPAAIEDGFETSEEDMWLLEQAHSEIEQLEAPSEDE